MFFYFCFEKQEKKILKGSRAPVHLSPGKYFSPVSDAELLPLVKMALENTTLDPRDFYAALMDYGAKLKREGVKLNKQSKHYTKQSKFEGSARQLRGAILRELLQKPQTLLQLTKNLSRNAKEINRELTRLEKEGITRSNKARFELSD